MMEIKHYKITFYMTLRPDTNNTVFKRNPGYVTDSVTDHLLLPGDDVRTWC